MQQKELNTFKRLHFDLTKPIHYNAIYHDPNTAPEHRKLVSDICEWAITQKRSFFTRVYLKNGKTADIVIPSLPLPFIEVRHSEVEKEKFYPEEYKKKMKFIDTNDPFRLL